MGSSVRSEVCQKLRAINCYIDDELPDYVMAMVGNRKSTSSMIKDLTLFLGEHTESFVKWLHGLLDKTSDGDSPKKDATNNQPIRSAAKLVSSNDRAKREQVSNAAFGKGINARLLSIAMAGANADTQKPAATPVKTSAGEVSQKKQVPQFVKGSGRKSSETTRLIPSSVKSVPVRSASVLHGRVDVQEEAVQLKTTDGHVRLQRAEPAVDSSVKSPNQTNLPMPAEVDKRVVQKPTNTRFIVTLDGAAGRFDSVARRDRVEMDEVASVAQPTPIKRSMAGTESGGAQLDQQDEEDAGKPPAKAARNLERCRYWPMCSLQENCRYHHPSAPCRNMPNCKFGASCLFIHPDCKFDGFCSRSDCPYVHRKVQSAMSTVPPVALAHAGMSPPTPRCKYFPNCSRPDCPFFHPISCRFGSSCMRHDCKFAHPERDALPVIASRSALTWTKKTHISDRKFAFEGVATSLPSS